MHALAGTMTTMHDRKYEALFVGYDAHNVRTCEAEGWDITNNAGPRLSVMFFN